jgi:hypothetical protein
LDLFTRISEAPLKYARYPWGFLVTTPIDLRSNQTSDSPNFGNQLGQHIELYLKWGVLGVGSL